MIELWIFASIGIVLSLITFSYMIHNIIKHKNEDDELAKQSNTICKDLKAILNDVKLYDDSEERYEIDLSLKSYFNDNRTQIQTLVNNLRVARSGFLSKKNKKLNEFGDLLHWTIYDFYRFDYEEDERIRIWSKNIQKFHSKMTNALEQNA